MSSSGPWRKQTAGETAAAAYLELLKHPWYGLQPIETVGGRLGPDIIRLGPALIDGVMVTVDGLMPGCYAVRARIEATRTVLPDWGCLLIRGPGSWVLRRRDGGEVIVPAGGDGVTVLKLWGCRYGGV